MNFPFNKYSQINTPPPHLPHDYEDFFESANGFKPYPYQHQFHQRDRHHSIHALIAPTGLGKTECFTVDWLWGICHDRANTPSRLVISRVYSEGAPMGPTPAKDGGAPQREKINGCVPW